MTEINKDSIKNVLIVSFQGLGDLLLFTPSLPILRKGFPKAKIYVLTLSSNKEILESNQYIDKVITFDIKKLFIPQIIRLIYRIRKVKFNLAICAYPGGLRSAIMCYLSGAKIRVGHRYDYLNYFPFLINYKKNVSEIKHAVKMNLDLMKALSLDLSYSADKLIFPLSDGDRKLASDFVNSSFQGKKWILIGMHCTSDELRKDKCWSIDNYNTLITALINEFNARIIIFGGKAETDEAKYIERSISSNNLVNLVGKLNLKQVAALIGECDIFISYDSGLVHLASAVGIPSVVIFGPTDPRIFAPYGVRHEIIRKPLECNPCAWGVCGKFSHLIKDNSGFANGRFYCKRGDFECLRGLRLEEVYRVIKKFIMESKRNDQ